MLQKNIYLFLLLISTVFQFQGQALTIVFSKDKKQTIESVLQQNRDFGMDTISLKKYLNPLRKTAELKVVYHAMLANGIAQSMDITNKQSDFNYLQSIALAKKVNDLPIEIWAELNYISYLYNYRDYARLTPILLEVIKKTRTINPFKIIFPGESFKKIGWILHTFNDYEDSQYYLKLAKSHTPKNSSAYASVLNSIGKNYLATRDLKKAAHYFNESAQLSKKIKDTLSYAKALGYLAEVYQKEGNLTKAISLLNEDISLSKSCRNDKNTMYASVLLSELYLMTNDLNNATEFLNNAIFIARSKSYFNISEFKIIKLQLTILQMQGKTNDELILRRRLETLDDSLKTKDGETAISNAKWIVNKTKYEQKINSTKQQYQKESFLKTIYALIAFLAAILTVFIYFIFKKKIKKRQLEYDQKVMSIEIDRLKMENKLSEAHENLNTQIEYLKSKNIQIKKLKSEIMSVKQSSYHYLEEKSGKLTALLESHLMTENNWLLFKREFKKEYPDFYQMILSEFKEITDSNMRILLLQKLDFSNNEIAELLGVTSEAIKKSKQRLKNKLGDRYNKLSGTVS